MKLIYTSENRFLVSNAKNIVENAGIPVTLKNEYASGGMGELPATETWPELWVLNNADYQQAVALLASLFNSENSKDWQCSNCSEQNDPSFQLCWNCQTESPLVR